MELEPNSYRKISVYPERDARDILVEIPRSITKGVDTIVDIGCGTGTITNMVAHAIPHRRVVAMDVDPAMLDYARNYTSGCIDFIKQDCGLPFDQINQEVKILEGSVDFVWSNYAIHWIPTSRRQNAIEMIHKLLKPGGVAYINLLLFAPILECCPKELRDELENILFLPSIEEQFASYKRLFDQTGFSSVEYTRKETYWTFKTVSKFQIVGKFSSVYGAWMAPDVTVEKRAEYFRALEEPFLVRMATGLDGTPPSDMKKATTVHYRYVTFIVKKD